MHAAGPRALGRRRGPRRGPRPRHRISPARVRCRAARWSASGTPASVPVFLKNPPPAPPAAPPAAPSAGAPPAPQPPAGRRARAPVPTVAPPPELPEPSPPEPGAVSHQWQGERGPRACRTPVTLARSPIGELRAAVRGVEQFVDEPPSAPGAGGAGADAEAAPAGRRELRALLAVLWRCDTQPALAAAARRLRALPRPSVLQCVFTVLHLVGRRGDMPPSPFACPFSGLTDEVAEEAANVCGTLRQSILRMHPSEWSDPDDALRMAATAAGCARGAASKLRVHRRGKQPRLEAAADRALAAVSALLVLHGGRMYWCTFPATRLCISFGTIAARDDRCPEWALRGLRAAIRFGGAAISQSLDRGGAVYHAARLAKALSEAQVPRGEAQLLWDAIAAAAARGSAACRDDAAAALLYLYRSDPGSAHLLADAAAPVLRAAAAAPPAQPLTLASALWVAGRARAAVSAAAAAVAQRFFSSAEYGPWLTASICAAAWLLPAGFPDEGMQRRVAAAARTAALRGASTEGGLNADDAAFALRALAELRTAHGDAAARLTALALRPPPAELDLCAKRRWARGAAQVLHAIIIAGIETEAAAADALRGLLSSSAWVGLLAPTADDKQIGWSVDLVACMAKLRFGGPGSHAQVLRTSGWSARTDLEAALWAPPVLSVFFTFPHPPTFAMPGDGADRAAAEVCAAALLQVETHCADFPAALLLHAARAAAAVPDTPARRRAAARLSAEVLRRSISDLAGTDINGSLARVAWRVGNCNAPERLRGGDGAAAGAGGAAGGGRLARAPRRSSAPRGADADARQG
eukprot:TRINITY_DN32832_c0_g1_i2.p1 TRINITY_DN32832_c0_g1~~TRINITY_DN32832_c0_g1_i2.p1  ORF type:complete len:811 (+),score=144.48 TRINITY_DN32832_c0_g1_i2:62-2494(+)